MTLKIKFLISAFVCLCSAAFCQPKKPSGIIFEAEKFQFQSYWNAMRIGEHSGLQVTSVLFEPCSVFEVKKAGRYAVWCSAYDNLEISQSSRKVKVLINGVELPYECGTHGEKTGFFWQKAGEMDLPSGEILVSLRAKAKGARVDAVYITQDLNFDPSGYFDSGVNRRRYRQEPKLVDSFSQSSLNVLPALNNFDGAKIFSLENDSVKIGFREKKDADGKVFYVRFAELKSGGKESVSLPEFSDEVLFLSMSEKLRLYPINYFCSWLADAVRPQIKVGGKNYDIVERATNPFGVGRNILMRICGVEKVSENRLELEFENGAKGEFCLSPKGFQARLKVSLKVPQNGYYSIGFSAFNKVPKDTLRAVCMPPSYQLKHLSDRAKLICSSMMSQPYCAVENRGAKGRSYVNAVVAPPEIFPADAWSNGYNSPCGFAVVSSSGEPQAAMFRPIIGSDESKKKAGEEISAEFILLSMEGLVSDAVDYVNKNIYASAHLREPKSVSLSTALENISEYLADRDASGWCGYLKGRWNIEGQEMATNASPLAELENALLTDSEDYYKNIALPAFEFSLSRATYHFIPRPGGKHSEGNIFSLKMCVPSPAWGADFYASENRLLGGGNPWLKEFCSPRRNSFYAPVPDWTMLFGRWLAEPSDELLQSAKTSADEWLKRVYSNDFSEPNVSFTYTRAYPYWYYLPDFYLATGDKKYLHYAVLGAYQTASAIWNYPVPKNGNMTIHKNGLVEGIDSLWYKGKEEYRMGLAETRGEVLQKAAKLGIDASYTKYLYPAVEKSVDAWQVSRVGIGIEAPHTLRASSHFRNIIMPAWAPALLRTGKLANKDLLVKFSRHSIIDRFANFYGYYVKDFTDLPLNPQYPYKGPDISSFYYHHAPCHFAYLYDYLMAQAESRAGDNVKFPYVRSQGFVWFTNRIYGDVGKLFGSSALPVLEKGAVDSTTPQVSTLSFRAENAVWILFLNDSASRAEILPKYNASSKLFKDAHLDKPAEVFFADGKKRETFAAKAADEKIKIPPLGLTAVKIAAEPKNIRARKQPPIKSAAHIADKDGFVKTGAEEVHAFRIRSPFGKDSLYVTVVCDWQKKMEVSLDINGKKYEDNSYPYEFSIYPLPQNADMNFDVEIRSDDLHIKKSYTLGQ